jgi:hypothetical protein
MCYRVAVLVVLSAFALVACDGNGEDDIEFCHVDVTIPLSTNTVANVLGLPISFPNGSAFSPDIGNNPVTLTFNTASTFTLAAGSATASGNVAFSSCLLTVTASTFPTGQGPQVGVSLNFPTCDSVISANSVEVGGGAVAGTAVLNFVNAAGTSATSDSGTVQVQVQEDGILVINDISTGIHIEDTETTCQ